MREITIQRETINFEALDGALRAALGEQLVGMSTGPSGVTVYLTDNASDEQEQQAEIERQQQLAELRETNSEPFALGNYDAQPSLIQELAQRIAWLEQEIADLRR